MFTLFSIIAVLSYVASGYLLRESTRPRNVPDREMATLLTVAACIAFFLGVSTHVLSITLF